MAESTGLFFAVFAVVIVASRPVVGNVLDRVGPSHVVYSTKLWFLLSAAILGLGFGALSPVFQTLAVQSVPASRAGAATATYFWFLDIFVGLAAMTLGLVAQWFGYSLLYGVLCPAVVLVTAALYYVEYTRRCFHS